MYKYLVIAILTLIFVTASDPYFGLQLSPPFKNTPADAVKETYDLPYRRIKPILRDYKDKVDPAFSISPFYLPTVQFWFFIYTHFPSSHVVIHDKSNLSIVYKVVDFSALRTEGVKRETLFELQQKVARQKLNEIKESLQRLILDPFDRSDNSIFVMQRLKAAGVTLPIGEVQRSNFFQDLKKNIRSQTGQKDFIQEGLTRSQPYRTFIYKYFKEKNLPTELIAIPFLESSFNPKAESRVSALGVWQFMPLIASYYVPRRTIHVDYRSNVAVASVAAAFLMTDNIRTMRSWDLAITAYNSGTRHLLSSKRKMKSTGATLEDIIKFSKGSDHFGFASKNFYSEFLALAYVLAYHREIFPVRLDDHSIDGEKDMTFSLAKCPMRIDKTLDEDQLEEVAYYNQQIRKMENIQPRGLIVTTKSALPEEKFIEVPRAMLLSRKPKDWQRLLNNQSCSTI